MQGNNYTAPIILKLCDGKFRTVYSSNHKAQYSDEKTILNCLLCDSKFNDFSLHDYHLVNSADQDGNVQMSKSDRNFQFVTMMENGSTVGYKLEGK